MQLTAGRPGFDPRTASPLSVWLAIAVDHYLLTHLLCSAADDAFVACQLGTAHLLTRSRNGSHGRRAVVNQVPAEWKVSPVAARVVLERQVRARMRTEQRAWCATGVP